MDRLIKLYLDLCDLLKLIQKKMFKYFNQKKSKGLDLKKGDKVQLLHKNFKSK